MMREASWNLYQTFNQEIGDGTTRVTYSDGRMEIMSPLPQHEKNKKLIARLVETMTEELGVVIGSLGSTTYSEQTLEKGLEPKRHRLERLRHILSSCGVHRLRLGRMPCACHYQDASDHPKPCDTIWCILL